jgi:hypothetical protein
VRERCGIGFPGAPYEHTFFVADTTAVGSMTPGELNVYLWRDGFHLFFPMRGANRWRVIGILPKALRQRDGVTFDDVAPSIVAEAGIGLDFKHCDWFSTYRIQHRSAERFRDGRCFLLGDAAHIHSPMGGQGMNTGLQDAYNLAWKLAAVVKEDADPALLDSYAAERMPVAQRLLDSTDRAFTLIVSDSWVASLLRTRVIAKVAATAMKVQRMRRLAFRTLSQIGIAYRGSALSQSLAPLPEAAPQPGDRFPWLHLRLEAGGPVEDVFAKLDDERFHLLAFGQRAELPAGRRQPRACVERSFGSRERRSVGSRRHRTAVVLSAEARWPRRPRRHAARRRPDPPLSRRTGGVPRTGRGRVGPHHTRTDPTESAELRT